MKRSSTNPPVITDLPVRKLAGLTRPAPKAATKSRTNGRTKLQPFVECDPRRLDDAYLAQVPTWELGAMFSAPHPEAAVVMAPGKLDVLPAPVAKPQPPAKPKKGEEEWLSGEELSGEDHGNGLHVQRG
jgi:hypothetical protein